MKKILLIIGLLGMVLSMGAQDDVRGRLSVSFQQGLPYGMWVGISEEVRAKNNFADFDRNMAQVEFGYKACPYFKAALVYGSIYTKKASNKWQYTNRLRLNLEGMYTVKGFTIAVRESPFVDLRNDYTNWRLRSRVLFQYEFEEVGLTPSFYLEISNTLNAMHNYVDRYRLNWQLDWKCLPYMTVGAYYRYDFLPEEHIKGESPFDVPAEQHHVVGISVKFKKDWAKKEK